MSKRRQSGSIRTMRALSKLKWERTGVIASCGMLGIMAWMMFCPVSRNIVQAEGVSMQETTGDASLSVALTELAGLDVSNGEFRAETATLTVGTENSIGYKIYIQTADGKSTLNNERTDQVINAVTGTVTPPNFVVNTWGYALGQGIDKNTANYQAVPTDAEKEVLAVESPTGSADDNYTLAIGAKINAETPAGEYANGIVVSVIAEPQPKPKDMSTISTMQEMTMEICQNTATDYAKALIDARNNKSYVVFKAKDGNCWMRNDIAITGAVSKANVAGGTSGTYNLVSGTDYYNKNNGYGIYYSFNAAVAGTRVIGNLAGLGVIIIWQQHTVERLWR